MDAFAAETTALAFCWKLTRADGIVLGLTSHDRPLRIDGLCYESRPGMTPSAVSISAGFQPDSMAVSGALSAQAISAYDLDAGRWDGAAVELFACDWTDANPSSLLLMRGYIGDVARQSYGGNEAGGSFSAEILSEMVLLSRGGAPATSPLCRAELGDKRCGVDMAGRFASFGVLASNGSSLTLDRPPENAGNYSYGRLRFVSGRLAGLDRRITSVAGVLVLLEEDLRVAGADGAAVLLFEGCDKRFETCSQRFYNGAWFDGEPHLPGNDALVRYGES